MCWMDRHRNRDVTWYQKCFRGVERKFLWWTTFTLLGVSSSLDVDCFFTSSGLRIQKGGYTVNMDYQVVCVVTGNCMKNVPFAWYVC
jgi:hypothetical protein